MCARRAGGVAPCGGRAWGEACKDGCEPNWEAIGAAGSGGAGAGRGARRGREGAPHSGRGGDASGAMVVDVARSLARRARRARTLRVCVSLSLIGEKPSVALPSSIPALLFIPLLLPPLLLLFTFLPGAGFGSDTPGSDWWFGLCSFGMASVPPGIGSGRVRFGSGFVQVLPVSNELGRANSNFRNTVD